MFQIPMADHHRGRYRSTSGHGYLHADQLVRPHLGGILSLAATNAEMKRKLERVRSSLPDPVAIYVRTVEGKVMEMEAKKQALADALIDGYALMNKVHD